MSGDKKDLQNSPVPVEIASVSPEVLNSIPSADSQKATSIDPTTTAEQNRKFASQRRINSIWEISQAGIAWMVVLTTCLSVFIGRVWGALTTPLPPEWWTILGLVIGFYFGRTNHTKTGGVDSDNKQGR